MSEVLTSLTDLFSFWDLSVTYTHTHCTTYKRSETQEKTSFWSPKIICPEEKFTIGIICRGS